MKILKPQPGPQEMFLSTPADIAIYGGSAGGGKTFALLMEPTRHLRNPRFGAVIFRRNSVDIKKEGALWDESHQIYNHLRGIPRDSLLDWRFPWGSKISMSHLEHEDSVFAWQGAQVPLIAFDELTHFTKKQFWYMLSRNRSKCGVKPYIRAGCNPDPDSFVAGLVSWYIDQDTGYPIPERSGVVRYFIRRGDDIIWGDTPDHLLDGRNDVDRAEIKSFTFIASSIYDNPALLDADPGYIGNLKALPLVERERLLRGNWKIKPAAGMYFKRGYFQIVDAAPSTARRVRYWDLAATEAKSGNDPDWTVGLRLSREDNGTFYVEHVERFQGSPHAVEASIRNLASSDSPGVSIGVPEDPGQAGKAQALRLVNMLAGYDVHAFRETGSKTTRAGGASAQAEIGNIKLVKGAWNEAFLAELENFPSPKSHDDQVDALSGAFNMLVNQPTFEIW